jgi:DNA-directed RNA polymerase specialized sigma24 family protein
MDSSDPRDPPKPPKDPAALPEDPPEPPKELASKEEKERLLHDAAFVSELRKKIESRVKRKEERHELLQDVLFAIMRAPVPKSPDEWQPYCVTIADNMAKAYAGAQENKPLTHAIPLDDNVQGDWIQQRTRTPEAILRDKEAVGFMVARTTGWGKYRGWFRSHHIDGESHASIAAKAGVAPDTVTNTLSLKRKDVERWKNLLIFALGLAGLPIIIKRNMYSFGLVSHSHDHASGVDSPGVLLLAVIAVIAVQAFVGVARRGRASRTAIVAALAATYAIATAWASVEQPSIGGIRSFPASFSEDAFVVLYASHALVLVGAGGLLAWMAARRFGFKGFAGVFLAGSLLGGLTFMLWDGRWSVALAGVRGVIWAAMLLPSYTFVWGLGRLGQAIGAWRDRRAGTSATTATGATAAAGAPAAAPLDGTGSGAPNRTLAESDDEPRAAE